MGKACLARAAQPQQVQLIAFLLFGFRLFALILGCLPLAQLFQSVALLPCLFVDLDLLAQADLRFLQLLVSIQTLLLEARFFL